MEFKDDAMKILQISAVFPLFMGDDCNSYSQKFIKLSKIDHNFILKEILAILKKRVNRIIVGEFEGVIVPSLSIWHSKVNGISEICKENDVEPDNLSILDPV